MRCEGVQNFEQNNDGIKLGFNGISLTASLRRDLKKTRIEEGGYSNNPCEK